MKKILSFLALALAFTACQTEPVETVSNSDLVDVVLTIDAPELGVTRADNDGQTGKNSALGAIDFMTDADWENYDLRYILEVYAADEDGTGEPIYRERLVNCLDKYAPTTFALRLVPNRDYKFVVFADFVAEGNAELTEPAAKLAIRDLYYNTADLRNVTAITTEPTWGAMNEVRDAYFITKNVTITTGLNETLTLTRPFAKLRVIATDLDYISGYSAPGYVEVTYKNEPIYKSFNAVNGKLNTEVMADDELTYGFEVNKGYPYTDGYDAYTTNQTLFADYLLAVEGEQTTVNFEMSVYESKGGRLIHSQDFNTQIPIQRNYLTTIIGDLLTTQANITIEIDDNFVDEFVLGWGDDNATKINVWNAGEMTTDGDYQFVVEGENDFLVTVNGAAVENAKLTAGDYVLAEDAEEGDKLTFTIEALQANETTRALVDVEVIGGTMKVEAVGEEYKITLDLVLQFVADKDVRHAIYVYEGPIAFGKVLDTPVVTATVEGLDITLTWEAVEGATSYTVAGVADMPVITEETSYKYTATEYETEYTFTVTAVSDDYVSQPYTVVAKTGEAPVAYKLYFNNLSEWAEVYAHIWANEGDDLGLESVDWPGRKLTETETIEGVTYYVFQLPAEATGKTVNVVFNDGAGSKTADLSGVATEDLYFDNYVAPVEPSDVVVYLKPNANWKVDNARFAAYFFGNGETWVDATLVEGETDIYAVTVPTGFVDIIFCRMNPNAADNNWGNKWNQTADLKVPADGTNLYTVKENTWDNGGGSWSVYTPTAVEPEEPVALVSPEVNTEVNVNVITLTWEAIEGASHYTVQVDDDVEEVVNGTSYEFEGDYEVEYMFTVKAIAADTTVNTDSAATIVFVTTEAKPAEEPVVTYTTVAEFLALTDVVPSDATAEEIAAAPLYTLKGTITACTQTTYGNFYLNDGTGEVLIYGLCSPEGESKYWAASGAKVGDDIVVKTIRTEYNGAPQGKNATFVELITPGTLAFWSFESTATSFTAAAGTKAIGLDIYNSTAEVVATSNNNQFSAAYADGVLTITALENTSEEAIEGEITVTCGALSQVISVSQLGASSGEQQAVEATLSFADKANRTEYSTSKQVWEQNGITVTNDKASSTTNVGDYANPGRFYKGSNVTIEAPGAILSIAIDVAGLDSKYVKPWGTAENGIVTIKLDGTSTSYSVTNLSAQARANKITVTYLE